MSAWCLGLIVVVPYTEEVSFDSETFEKIFLGSLALGDETYEYRQWLETIMLGWLAMPLRAKGAYYRTHSQQTIANMTLDWTSSTVFSCSKVVHMLLKSIPSLNKASGLSDTFYTPKSPSHPTRESQTLQQAQACSSATSPKPSHQPATSTASTSPPPNSPPNPASRPTSPSTSPT